MREIDHVIASTRFGLGGTYGGSSDPRVYLLDQIERFDPAAGVGSGPKSSEVIRRMREMRRISGDNRQEKMTARQGLRRILHRAIDQRFEHAVATQTPFAERLVHFWANHFAISTEKFSAAPMGGTFEAEAIRPHIAGRFADMLHAVESHPAMLLYLDQAQSVGPDSPLGQRIASRRNRAAGLNENLAREILELHTLGIRSGYSQADVTEFARVLTGWSVAGLRNRPQADEPGFVFWPAAHQPGERRVLGKCYAAAGEKQGRDILDDLAIHPATANFIATKLARHFVADDPPPTLVERLSRNFMQTGGDLPKLYRTLIESPEAWTNERQKFLSPFEWVVSSLRLLDHREPRPNAMRQLMRNLGQELWRPGSPAGFEDRTTRWAAPDSLYRRVEAANQLARFGVALDAQAIADQAYGDFLSDNSRSSIMRAESPVEAMALLLASPEGMWR